MLFETTNTLKRILYLTPISGNDITSINTHFTSEGTIEGSSLFSYSFDDVNWSDYTSSEDCINLLSSEDTSSITTYLRMLVIVSEKQNTTFCATQYNHVGLSSVEVNGDMVGVVGIEYYNEINILRDNQNSNQYNPYRGMDNIHHIREQITESINAMFGQVSTYFPTTPNESNKSIIFKSYKVFNTEEPKQLKVMINTDDDYNGDVQSFQYYSDYENMEVEISKITWESTFGDLKPTPKDAVYINIFKKMFRIVQVKEDRNFMNQAVAYKFYLGKYIEGVEVDHGDSKAQIDNFTEFLTFDSENSDYADAESQNATGVHDDIEHTFVDRDTIETNTNSKMVYYKEGISNVETGLVYQGVNYQRYMYHNTGGSDFITKYDITGYNKSNYTVSIWVSPLDIGKSLKILQLGNGDSHGEQLYINAKGYVTAHINGASTNKYITSTGESLESGGYYGIMYSRMGESIIINVVKNVDGSIVNVQDIILTGVQSPSVFNRLNVYSSENLMVGNIRMANESLSSSKVIQLITDYNPDAHKNIVIDNCNPTVTGIKVNSIY